MKQKDDTETETSTADTSDTANADDITIVICAHLATDMDAIGSWHNSWDLEISKAAVSDEILFSKILDSRSRPQDLNSNAKIDSGFQEC